MSRATREHALSMAAAIAGTDGCEGWELLRNARQIEAYLEDGWSGREETPAEPEAPAEPQHVSPDFPFATPHPFQECLWKSLLTSDRLLIHSARQMGLTSILSHFIVVQMSLNPGIHVLLSSPAAGTPTCTDVLFANGELRSVEKSKIVHDNGSVLYRHANNGADRDYELRGHGFDLIVADNMEFLSFKREPEFSACMATCNHVVLASGPSRGLFRRLWTSSKGWDRVLLPWHVHPQRDKA